MYQVGILLVVAGDPAEVPAAGIPVNGMPTDFCCAWLLDQC